MKTCTACEQELSLDRFLKEKRTKDGLRSECKTCFYRRNYKYIRDKCACGTEKLKRSELCSTCRADVIHWHKNKHGYLVSCHKGQYISQHRWVMANNLGRPLLPGENVHHKNGKRDDNRIENLEIWITSQPSGQRIEDVVAWAKEILLRYGDNRER